MEEPAIEGLEKAIGRTLATELLYEDWNTLANEFVSGNFPDTDLQGAIEHGRIPIISWKCDSNTQNSDDIIATSTAEDIVIINTAKALAKYPGPVFLRWNWEFNNQPDGKTQTCLGDGDTSGRPTAATYAAFRAAWQRIWFLFQSNGATNVRFLWNPSSYNATLNNDPGNFYPGNAFVDWLGIDTYQDKTDETFADNITQFYTDYSNPKYDGKPLMVGENGSRNDGTANPDFQVPYLKSLLAALDKGAYPLIKGYNYFDAVGPNGSWTFDPLGLTEFIQVGQNPYFNPKP